MASAGNGNGAATLHGAQRDRLLGYLDSLLGSPAFASSRRRGELLRYLVEQTLAGQADAITEYAIGLDVYRKPESFDPRIDSSVRSEVSRLRRTLTQYYEEQGATDPWQIAFPSGYIPVMTEVAEPPQAAIEPPVPAGMKPPRRVRPVYLIAGALVVLTLILGAVFRLKSSIQTPASIVVLPFKNLSADPANQYFSDGLTDEITDALSHLKPLRVIARASAFQFRDKTGDIRGVGQQLNVTNVLEGSVERYGNRVKIVARLERVSDGAQIWSSTYERRTSDLFSVQSELAARIAASLKASVEVPNPARHIVRDEEARDAFMRATYEAEQFTPEALSKAEADLKHAIERDPEYAAAYAALGVVTNNRFNASNKPDHASLLETVKTAGQYYRKALELDPDLVAPRINLARSTLQFDWDWGRAEREFQTALAKGPNAVANQSYGLLLVYQGRFAEADNYLRLAEEENPYATARILNTAMARGLEGRFAQARELAQGLLTRFPNMPQARLIVDATYVQEHRPELALADYRKLEPQGPLAKMSEAWALAGEGQREEALGLIRPFEEHYQNGQLPMAWFAVVYACLGDEASTLKWLERSADWHESQAVMIGVEPTYARMRGAPGFRALMKRVGLEH